ncbi:MAG: hypothetical protein OXC11_15930 [Rhodospirillales bacterium]|nr:hypothetical protein [Rhodospirillales bacterium]
MELELVLGLDFGTSSTKIVVRAPDLPNSPAYPVQRLQAQDGFPPWLWPSRVELVDDGSYVLPSSGGLRDVKRPLLGISDRPSAAATEAEGWAIAFLALVLRQARESFLLKEAESFRGFRSLRWDVNIGFPSDAGHQEDGLRRRFRRMAMAAQSLSEKVRITRAEVQKAWSTAGENTSLQSTSSVAAIPEIVGGAAAYVRGPQRRNGLHVFIDIGATTLDVCLGRIHRVNGEDLWSLLAARVTTLGVVEWNQTLLAAACKVDPVAATTLAQDRDPLDPVAGDLALGTEFVAAVEVDRARRMFRSELRREAIGWVLYRAFRQKDHMWNLRSGKHELHVLLMGGGSHSTEYKQFINRIFGAFGYEGKIPKGARMIRLPLPAFPRAPPDSAHRLGVAFGLSHRAFDLGVFRTPDEVSDRPLVLPDRRQYEFVDKDHV